MRTCLGIIFLRVIRSHNAASCIPRQTRVTLSLSEKLVQSMETISHTSFVIYGVFAPKLSSDHGDKRRNIVSMCVCIPLAKVFR